MVNFDDMTLEELQQLLEVDTKDPEAVKRIQEIAGLTGRNVDGKWGKQTSKAWNNFLNKHQSDIEQAIDDKVGYSAQLDAQAAAKIAQLEEQIAQVKERIARNERTLTNKSYEDVNSKLADLEMSKIGLRLNKPGVNQDPSSFWRWNMQRLDTLKSNDALKNDAANKFANTVDMWVNTRPANSTEGIQQQISNINSAIRDGKNVGADVSRLEEKKNEFEKLVYGDDTGSVTTGSGKYTKGTSTEKRDADVKDMLSKAKTSDEIAQYLAWNRAVLTPEQVNQLSAKQRELGDKERDRAEAAEFEEWLKKNTKYKTGSKGVSPKILATLERQYKDKGGK